MQDPLQILYKVSKNVEARIQQLAVSVTSGNVDNFEQYRYIFRVKLTSGERPL